MGNIMAPAAASLYDAIAGGDADAAVQALQEYPELTRKRLGTKRRNLYHICASSGQMAVLRSLCEYVWRTVPDETGRLHDAVPPTRRVHPAIRPAINAVDQKGLTPLSLACKNGHARVVEYLIAQGADPWIKDRLMGRTPLHHAARANNPDCIEAILTSPYVAETGKSRNTECRLVDYPNNSGYTPLHYAAASHSVEAAAALCRHGADPNAKTWDVGFDYVQLDRGCTPLHAAARCQNLDVSMLLLKYWYDNLKSLDVTDPRVVDNFIRLKPYQMSGVKLNKALHRVLDPATPILDVADPFGAASRPIVVPPGKAAYLQKMRSSTTTGFIRQDSDLSHLSDGSGGGPAGSRAGTAGTVSNAANTLQSAGNGSALQRSGSPSNTRETGATAGLQVPPGWEDLLPLEASGNVKGRGSTPNFISVYRCPDLDTVAAGASVAAEAANLPPVASNDPASRYDDGSRRGAPSASALPAASTLGRTRSGQVVPVPFDPCPQLHRTASLQQQQQGSRQQNQHLGQQHPLAPAASSCDSGRLQNGDCGVVFVQAARGCPQASTSGRGAGFGLAAGSRAGSLSPQTGGVGSTGVGGADVRMIGAATMEGLRSTSGRDAAALPGPTHATDDASNRGMRRIASNGARETSAAGPDKDKDRSVGKSLARTISRKTSYLSNGSYQNNDIVVRTCERDAPAMAGDQGANVLRPPMVISAWGDRTRETATVR